MNTKTGAQLDGQNKKSERGRKISLKIADDRGSTAVLYYGGFVNTPDAEDGPQLMLVESQLWGDCFGDAQKPAANRNGYAFGMDTKCALRKGPIVLITPHVVTEPKFLSIAGSGGLTIGDANTAFKALKIVATRLRGADFLQYVARLIDVISPRAVVINPVEFYLGQTRKAERVLLHETGWLTHQYQRVAGSASSRHDRYRRDCEDDPADWWKP